MKSIYITAMEIGSSNLKEGISYTEVKRQVQKEHNFVFKPNSEFSFIIWFLENYFSPDFKDYDLIGGWDNGIRDYLYRGDAIDVMYRKRYEKFKESIFFLKGDAEKKLIDYQELRDNRRQSKRAFIMALLALILTLIVPFIKDYYFAKEIKTEIKRKEINKSLNSVTLKKNRKGITTFIHKDTITDMKVFTKIVTDFISERDTETKRFLHKKKLESNYSPEVFIDDILYKCGMISANVILNLDTKNKYNAYIKYDENNIFKEKKGIRELTKNPVSDKEAQTILANKVIAKLNFIRYEKLVKIIE